MNAIRTLSPTTARRLAIARQRLAGPNPRANAIDEPDAPTTKTIAKAVERAIEELGGFLGAQEIVYR